MNTINKLRSLFTATLVMSVLSAHAQMDVDQADSLDFETFHTDKEQAVKLWDSNDDSKEVKKIYTEEHQKTTVETPPQSASNDSKGKRFEIRELYSIVGSDRTGYNPNTVVQALFLQMQGLCSNGWKKLDERSVPDGEAFYMYYQFECL
ncbi:MAG: hypothetical protein WCY88_09225 [Spongiibacteraceae bacterium]